MSKNSKPVTQANPSPEKDDALFEALGRSNKKKKRRILRTVIAIVLILALVLVAGTLVLQRRVREQFATRELDVLSYEVTTGTISTVVSGSGTIQNVDTETVSIPSGVELTEILVSYGDTVETGKLIAIADMGTVRTALSELQEAIKDLDEQISDASDDKVSAYIKAGVTGRVKVLYADKDTNVADAMVEHGALALISLDGYMAADIQTDTLSTDESVTVIRSDGSEIDGVVELSAGGKATILVTDNGPAFDEEITVLSADGTKIGSGRLYVHNPLAVTGYAGTVSRVYVYENQKVYSSTSLFALTNRSSSANYATLLRQRKEIEETLLELLQIQRNGGITAPIAGSIYAVSSLDVAEGEELTEVATISPDIKMSVTITVDENDVLSLALGQEANVTVRSVGEDALAGVVTELDKSGASESYTAVVELDKISGMLPGMTASVDVRIEGVDDAMIIPVDALNQTSTGAYVYTSYNEETQEYGGRVDVITGLSNDNYVEIKSGLSIGDTVYYTESQSFNNLFGQFGSGRNPGNMGVGQMPRFGGNMPSNNMPGGSNFGGGQPSGFNGNRPSRG